jgi:Lysophospholipase L1 and related esterases
MCASIWEVADLHKKIVWCFIAAVLMLTGCQSYKKTDMLKNTVNDTYAFKTSNPINITIIGDSVARGTGDEKGSGFSTYLPEYIEGKINGNISIYNDGINGLKSSGLVDLLHGKELGKRIADSDLIVISIGGNDILRLNYTEDNKKLSALKSTEDEYLGNLKSVLNLIREKNSGASIVLVGLYNPRQDASPLINTILGIWNRDSYNLIKEYSNAYYIDVNDIFKSHMKDYISSDSLHPNSAGYQAVSRAIANIKRQN